MSLESAARAYWTESNRENYLELQREIQRTANYSPYSTAMGDISRALAAKDYPAVIGQLRPLLPGAFMSPSFHDTLAVAHMELGDEVRALREARYAQLALRGIALTGDGSKEKPYIVLRVQDEYDMLNQLEKVSVRQQLVQADGKMMDQHICDDGSSIWFDISAFALTSELAREIGGEV
ncbi:MAG: DUF4919 domain-containing protein [Ardenticatenales bacterium]|nr:DUF4919 domain-containing protein [Ardenticatenales bacterium]